VDLQQVILVLIDKVLDMDESLDVRGTAENSLDDIFCYYSPEQPDRGAALAGLESDSVPTVMLSLWEIVRNGDDASLALRCCERMVGHSHPAVRRLAVDASCWLWDRLAREEVDRLLQLVSTAQEDPNSWVRETAVKAEETIRDFLEDKGDGDES
jgi:hypothetical protein